MSFIEIFFSQRETFTVDSSNNRYEAAYLQFNSRPKLFLDYVRTGQGMKAARRFILIYNCLFSECKVIKYISEDVYKKASFARRFFITNGSL